MSESIRLKFEAANPVPFGIFWSEPDSRYMTSTVHLNCLEYHGKWLGWQSAVLAQEAGKCEPVAWANGEQLKLCAASPREVQPNNPMMHNLPRNIAGSALPTEYCNTPLFAAPPAPVSVDERAEFLRAFPNADMRTDGSFIHGEDQNKWRGWQARSCLDKVKELNQ